MVRTKEQRLELSRIAQTLHDDGKNLKQIAELLNISRGYASQLIHDPDGAKERARKAQYSGTCQICGAPTSGGNGRTKAPKICATCYRKQQHRNRYWTAERIIAQIQRWAETHDGKPPTATDWNTKNRGDGYPTITSVYKSTSNNNAPFQCWADAIEAAGFPRPRQSSYPRTQAWRDKQSEQRKVWTPQRITQAITLFHQQHGRPPYAAEWTHTGENHPTLNTITKTFKSFNAAIRAAGLTPLKPTTSKKGQILTIEELAQRSRTLNIMRKEDA